MSDQLPMTGAGTVLAATGLWTGQWWVAVVAVALVIAGALIVRLGRRRTRHSSR